MNYYAHTGLSKYNIPAQLYADHIGKPFNGLIKNCSILSDFLKKVVLIAYLQHDFGKLIPESQKILCLPDKLESGRMVNHVDAGVAWCLREYKKSNDIVFIYAAYLIHAHHIGLQNRNDLFIETVKRMTLTVTIQDLFRDTKFNDIVNKKVNEYFDSVLDDLEKIQYDLLKPQMEYALSLTYTSSSVTPMDLRFALSVLVETDHGDTSYHYGAPKYKKHSLKANLRLKKLHEKVIDVQKAARLKGISQDVIDSRNVLFNECSTVDVSKHSFFVCSAPTGKGKTFSLMNLSLRIADVKKKEKIFFIIPFTNIISQSVENYRKNVLLDNENPLKIVNEIHSKVEFQHWSMRKYSQLWNSPINISTSVQFFESLFSNKPAAVRKLMQFANSVIVFDEFHTGLPHHLWNVVLFALKDISIKYNIDFVFGSGTHVYYWDIFDNTDISVLDVVSPKVFEEFKNFEKERVEFTDIGTFTNDIQLYDKIKELAVENDKLKGNTIIVCNTVKNAVYITKWFEDNTNFKTFHLSSYLTPVDREKILKKIHEELKLNEKILLVATSVVECGVDFSFEIGFREYGSMMSTIQFAGRVNRNKENTTAPVYEFKFDSQFLRTGTFSSNPSLSSAIRARAGVDIDPDNCTYVIKNEISIRNQPSLVDVEDMYKFSSMHRDFVVIDNLTVSIIIDKTVISKMQQGLKVEPVEISRNSISIYKNKIDPQNPNNWLPFVQKFNNDDDVLFWVGPYDSEKYGAYAFLV